MRRAALLALAASIAGAAVPEPLGYRLENYRAPVPDTIQGGSVIHTGALHRLIEQRKLVLIDVLPAPTRPPGLATAMWMPLPHRDIPGSLWLPDVGRGALDPKLAGWFRDRLALATSGRLEREVVFYCLSQCWMSWNATKRAVELGYSHAIWYPEGADGWQAAGLPVQIATPEMPAESH